MICLLRVQIRQFYQIGRLMLLLQRRVEHCRLIRMGITGETMLSIPHGMLFRVVGRRFLIG